MNTKNYKFIKVDLSNETSIRKAERLKASYENKGYTLISEEVGMFHAKFIYKIN
jgi:hypothetical protein